MNWALLATVVSILITNGPQIIAIIEEGIAIEQAIVKLDPQLIPNIEKLLASLFPHLGITQAQIITGLSQLNKPTQTIPGYASDGSVTEIPYPP